MSSLADLRESMGALLTPEQKQELEEMGERYFQHIDVDKYKPVRPEDFKEEFVVDHEQYEYARIVMSLRSGLDYEDLTEQEQKLFNKMELSRPAR